MAPPTAKRKRFDDRERIQELKTKIKDHVAKVNRGQVEAEYDENDLTANSNDPGIDKYKKRIDFEILPLKYEGKVTGWGKCTICDADPGKKSVFKISEGMSGMKSYLIVRHLDTHHATEEEKRIAKNKNQEQKLRQQGQAPMSDFLQKRQLTPAQISELREINLQIISSTNTSLSFFSKEIVQQRDRRLLEMCGYDPRNAAKFDKSRETIKRDARKISDENLLVIRKEAEKWAEDGRVAFQLDHKATLNTHGDKENNGLGVAMTLVDKDFQKHHYLLDYIPCEGTDMDSTILLARDVFQVKA